MTEQQMQNFRAASRSYSDASVLMHEAIARKAGLSGTDHKYLGLIMRKGTLTAGELAKLTGLTTGAVTGLIDRLADKGLVRRQFDPEDRRKVIIVPETRAAMQLLEPLFTELQQRTAVLIESFTEAERATIERYFSSAVAIMQQVTENLNNP